MKAGPLFSRLQRSLTVRSSEPISTSICRYFSGETGVLKIEAAIHLTLLVATSTTPRPRPT